MDMLTSLNSARLVFSYWLPQVGREGSLQGFTS